VKCCASFCGLIGCHEPGIALDWLPQKGVPALGTNAIHVWRAFLDDEKEASHLWALLNSDERERADRFHFERDRRRFVAARGTLRRLLGAYLGVAPRDLRFVYGRFGKPSLTQSEHEKLAFNLSHSDAFAVFAVAWRRALGIDVEKLRMDYGGEDVARRFFAPGEVRQLLELPADDRRRGFFDIWTRKEATIKARGEGIGTLELADFEVSATPGEPARFLRGVDPSWRIREFQADPDYPGALVYQGSLAQIRFFSFG
jgi:4'-phosphopantetheinyl transferase